MHRAPNPSLNADAWRYSDRVPEPRRIALAQCGSFDHLVELVRDDARDVRVRAQRGFDRGLTDCTQPVFTFELPNTGDALFNGPYGYRAQYWISPAQGLAANAILLVALAPKLLGAIDPSDADLTKLDVCASIHAASAKLWIGEIPSLLLDPTVDLAVARWAVEAQNGVELARFGLCAPEASRFEVKGALLDPYGHEVVPVSKIRRHYDIHEYGYS
jgi:hypothetical protein